MATFKYTDSRYESRSTERSDFQRQLAEGLDSGQILPSGIRAKVLPFEHPVKAADRPPASDLLVEFTVERLSQKIMALVEFKSRLTPMVLEGAIHQLLLYRNELRSTVESRDFYPMLAAPYISTSVQQRCKELGVGYVDLNGTFALIHDGIYVDVVRPATMFKPQQGIKNIFSGRSCRIIRVLLSTPHKPFRLEALASETNLSIGQISHVLRRLQEDGFLERTPQGRMLTKPRKLLRSFSEELKEDYAAKRRVFYGFSESEPGDFANRLRECCERRGVRCAFTLSSGLEPHERNVREDLTAAYISVPPEEIIADLDVEAVGKGSNVVLMAPPPVDNTDAGGVFYKLRRLGSGLLAVNPIQLYLDFTLYKNRGEEQAQFLLEQTLAFSE